MLPVAVPTQGTPAAPLAALARRTAGRRAAPRAASAVLLDAGFRLIAATGMLPRLLDHRHLVTTFVTDLRGPERPVTLVGARIHEVVPATTTTGNVPVVFAALSYAGVLTLTVVADPDTCSELDALVTELRRTGRALRAAPLSSASPGGSAAAPVARLMTPSHR